MEIHIPAGMAWWVNYIGMEEFPDTCSHKIFCSFWYVGPNPEVLQHIFRLSEYRALVVTAYWTTSVLKNAQGKMYENVTMVRIWEL